jgi:hypothetical protein
MKVKLCSQILRADIFEHVHIDRRAIFERIWEIAFEIVGSIWLAQCKDSCEMYKHDYESSIKTGIFLSIDQLSYFQGWSSTVTVCMNTKCCIWTHCLMLLLQGQHCERDSHAESKRSVGAYYQRFHKEAQDFHIKCPNQQYIIRCSGSYCCLHLVVMI